MLRRWLPVLVLLACILGVHAGATDGARWTAHHDNLDGAAPLRVEAARQWKSGHLPLWNPFKRAGMPLLADTTAGAIYPGNLPFLLVASPPETAGAASGPSVFEVMDQVATLHAVLAGLFLFVFLRTIGVGPAAAVLGAFVYACSGTMGWFAAWYIQIQNSVVWAPLILAAVHRVASGSGNSTRWVSIGAAAVALQWLAGYPEVSFYSGVVAVAYAASLLHRAHWTRPVVAVAAIYTAGILLAAVQLLPALELQSLSRRPATLSLEMFQSLPASVAMLWGWMLPSPPAAFEFPPTAAYHFGMAAVLAAAVALAGLSRRTVFFGLLLVIGTLLSLGAATPVNAWLWHLPVFGAFRHPHKHMFEISLAMSVLAGIGADRLRQIASRDARWPLAVVAAAVVVTFVSLRHNQAVLVAANPAQVDTSGATPAMVAHLEPGWRLLTMRQVFQKRDPSFLIGDYPTWFRVPAVQGAGPFLWSALADATGTIEEEITTRPGLFDTNDRTLALLSCRYMLQTRSGNRFLPRVDPDAYPSIAETEEARLIERAALPRYRFVDAATCAGPEAIEASLHQGRPDPRDIALVSCAAGDSGPEAPSNASSLAVSVVDERPGHVVLATTVPAGGSGFLVVSQSDFPGWRASADGKAVPIRRVHGLVQGIEVPRGTSRVELSYRPLSFVVGAAISAATLLLLVAANLAASRRRPEQGS